MPYGHYIFMQYNCRDAMLRVFTPTGFIVKFVPFHLVLNQDLQDFEDYRERLCFNRKGHLSRITLYPTFRRCITHRRKALE